MATPEASVIKPADKKDTAMIETKPLDWTNVVKEKPKINDFQFLSATLSKKTSKTPLERILKLSSYEEKNHANSSPWSYVYDDFVIL